MAKFDAELRNTDQWRGWEERGNHKFAVEHEGKRYPVKQIVAMVSGAATNYFKGGNESNSWLRQRGFEVIELRSEPAWWWVNQGKQFEIESKGGYLWAAIRQENGAEPAHWSVLSEIQPGDIVFHYAYQGIQAVSVVSAEATIRLRPGTPSGGSEEADGRLVAIDTSLLETPIRLSEIPVEWRAGADGPFDKNGGVKQGYAFSLDGDFVARIAERFAAKLPADTFDWESLLDGRVEQSVSDIGSAVERMYPDSAIRKICLELFADSIERANAIAPSGWSTRLRDPRSLRLNVGRAEACVLGPESLYLVLDSESLDKDAQSQLDSASLGGSQFRGTYSSMRFAYGVQFPASRIEEILPIARDAHDSLVDRAARLVRSRTSFHRSHQPEVVEYLRTALDRNLPQPRYYMDPPPPKSVSWWVEKTEVSKLAYRQEGEFSLGHAVVAPLRSNAGADLYWAVREAMPGDIVLHFTDQEAFTGWSRVASKSEEIETLPEFGISLPRALILRLEDFHVIDPPLDRQTIFAPSYSDQLRKVFEGGKRRPFYWIEPELRLATPAYFTPASDQLVAVLQEAYRDQTGGLLGPFPVGEVNPPPPSYGEPPFPDITAAIEDQGMRLDPRTLRRYHLALKTRGFVVLSGLSGTGKTWLAEAYATSVGARHVVVAVAPNWTTNEDLLGYHNPLTGVYHHTTFSTFVGEAAQAYLAAEEAEVEPQPYHLVLDEMNLARVEYYFAQFLSAMEVRARHGSATMALGGGEKLLLPPNLFVIGTVNVDETTHGFADKVYDRAQLIELGVRWDDLNAHVSGKAYAIDILDIWDAVKHAGPFAFRILDEIATYVSAAEDMDAHWSHALDEQILQKVLPKLKGADPRVGAALEKVVDVTVGRFPLSHAKAARMLSDFQNHGFASYFG